MTTSELNLAHHRVQKWLNAFREAPEFDRLRPMHSAATGVFLMSDDLEALLKATAPQERMTPALSAPKSRLKKKDPETSFWAASSVSTDTAAQLYRIIRQLLLTNNKIKGLTDEELIDVLARPGVFEEHFTPSGVRSRRAELVEAGWVMDSGVKRELKSGRMGIVWKAVPDWD